MNLLSTKTFIQILANFSLKMTNKSRSCRFKEKVTTMISPSGFGGYGFVRKSEEKNMKSDQFTKLLLESFDKKAPLS